jgi:hypothetical protein
VEVEVEGVIRAVAVAVAELSIAAALSKREKHIP